MAVEVTPDGPCTLSTSDDHSLRLSGLGDGPGLAAFRADVAIQRCAVSQDGKRIVAGDALGRIRVLGIQQ